MSQTPPRLARFLLQLQKCDIVVRYQPGKNQFLSDTLSRLNLPESSKKLAPEVEINETTLNSHLPVSPEKYEQFQMETEKDNQLQMLIQVVKEGWPIKKVDVHEDIKVFWPFRHEISNFMPERPKYFEITMIDGLVFKGWKLIIPRTLRKDM